MLDNDGRERFFEKSFLLADVKPDIVLRMSFLIMSNADVDFQARDLHWRFYTTKNVLPTTRQVKLIGKKEFAVAVLDSEHEIFVIHVAALSVDPCDEVHASKKAQIAHLKADEAPTEVPSEYTNFADVFSRKLAAKLLKHMRINDHAIKLVDDQQPLYGLIYSLGSIELETLKAYIKNNLTNSFIRLSKSLVGAPILFNKKPDSSIRLRVDYQGLHDLTIKNQYLLLLVGELLN